MGSYSTYLKLAACPMQSGKFRFKIQRAVHNAAVFCGGLVESYEISAKKLNNAQVNSRSVHYGAGVLLGNSSGKNTVATEFNRGRLIACIHHLTKKTHE